MSTFDLVAPERRRLADELDQLGADDWARPSLCGAWTNHEVAAHLNVPFVMGPPAFLMGMLRARGNFDKANAGFARDLAAKLDPAGCVAGLRANAAHKFTPPGFKFEAPLTDTIAHGADILRPLGRSVAPDPEALRVVLTFLASGKARRFGAVDVRPISLAATDLDSEAFGAGGALLSGPSVSLVGALLGRRAFLADLTGPGVDVLSAA